LVAAKIELYKTISSGKVHWMVIFSVSHTLHIARRNWKTIIICRKIPLTTGCDVICAPIRSFRAIGELVSWNKETKPCNSPRCSFAGIFHMHRDAHFRRNLTHGNHDINISGNGRKNARARAHTKEKMSDGWCRKGVMIVVMPRQSVREQSFHKIA
jgi:hypothetical protein